MEIKCSWCGKIKENTSFVIGASNRPDWVMVYGTGKMTCPDCHPKAMIDAENAEKEFMKRNRGRLNVTHR